MRLITETVIDSGQRYLGELGPHGGTVAYARLELAQVARLLRTYHVAAIDADTGEVVLWRAGLNVHDEAPIRRVCGPRSTAKFGHCPGYEAFYVREPNAFQAWAAWWTINRGEDGRPESMTK